MPSVELQSITDALNHGDAEHARRLLEPLLQNPTAEVLVLAAKAAISQEQAVHYLSHALSIDPTHQSARNLLAQYLHQTDDTSKADERAYEAHLEEFKSLRGEIELYTDLESRLVNYSIVIIAGAVTLFSVGTTGISPQEPFLLLVASILLSAIAWAFTEAEIHIHDVVNYIKGVLVPRIQLLVADEALPQHQVLGFHTLRNRQSGRVALRGITGAGKFLIAYVPSILLIVAYFYFRSPARAWEPPEIAVAVAAIGMAALLPVGLLLNVIFIMRGNRSK